MNPDRLLQFTEQIIDKDRQAGDMVHVSVGNDYITHAVSLLLVERYPDATGVDGDALVDQKARQTLGLAGAAIGIE